MWDTLRSLAWSSWWLKILTGRHEVPVSPDKWQKLRPAMISVPVMMNHMSHYNFTAHRRATIVLPLPILLQILRVEHVCLSCVHRFCDYHSRPWRHNLSQFRSIRQAWAWVLAIAFPSFRFESQEMKNKLGASEVVSVMLNKLQQSFDKPGVVIMWFYIRLLKLKNT